MAERSRLSGNKNRAVISCNGNVSSATSTMAFRDASSAEVGSVKFDSLMLGDCKRAADVDMKKPGVSKDSSSGRIFKTRQQQPLHSADEEEDVDGSLTSKQVNVTVVRSLDIDVPATFPQKLMEILSSNEYSDIICWLPHGRGFIVRQKSRFASDVLPRFFRQSKYTSFTRKLNRWGFQRVTRGPEAGAYYHDLFRKDRPSMCLRMSCYSGVKAPTVAARPSYSAAAFTSILHSFPIDATHQSMFGDSSAEIGRTSMSPIGVGVSMCMPSQASGQTQMSSPMHISAAHSVSFQNAFPVQFQQQMQQQQMLSSATSSSAVTEAELHRHLLQLQALERAKAEADAIRHAIEMSSGSCGHNMQMTNYPYATTNFYGHYNQASGIPSSRSMAMMTEELNVPQVAQEPSPGGVASASIFTRDHMVPIDSLRYKGSGELGGINGALPSMSVSGFSDMLQTQQRGFAQQQGGSPQIDDSSTQHKRFRASAA